MTSSMKLFVFLWLITIGRIFAAAMAGRQCMRMRHITKYRQLYEWLTAFGLGLIVWSISDFASVLNQIFNGPQNRDQYPSSFLRWQMLFEIIKTAGVWLIYIVMINGGAPGIVRASIFWVLTKTRVMDTVQESRPELPKSRV